MIIGKEQIERTLAIWQPRSEKPLTEDDARRITTTLYELVTLLRTWYQRESNEQLTDRQAG